MLFLLLLFFSVMGKGGEGRSWKEMWTSESLWFRNKAAMVSLECVQEAEPVPVFSA